MLFTQPIRAQPLADWNFGQTNILHDGPNNREARRLGCEGVNLIGALPHEASQALNRVGGANVAMHNLRKGIKGQQMVFLLAETADRFRIALALFAFEGREVCQRFLFGGRFPDACKFCCDVLLLAVGDSIHDVSLFMNDTALAQRSRKE